jgi:MauM/NapG family ferredoxin protein
MRLRRTVQLVCLVLFLALLGLAALSGTPAVMPDLFLRLDPGLVLISAISARIVLLGFIPAAVVLILGPFVGRVFCGYVCPMGTTIDGSDALLGPHRKVSRAANRLTRLKYMVLVFLLGSAMLGVSYVFFAAPLALITRAYGVVLFPVISFLSMQVLDFIRPLGEMLDLSWISFGEVRTIRFASQFFLLFFFTAVLGLVIYSPRFWCRYLCPSGALLALASRSPLIRRRVSQGCSRCGRCVRHCPMGAIAPDAPQITKHSECIVCRTCVQICPEKAVSFGGSKGVAALLADRSPGPVSPARRQFVATGLMGAGSAVISLTGLNSLYGTAGPGQVGAAGLIRPPGAVPENDFLSRCVRCGECMVACPTNTLQPIGLKAGLTALFSPAVTPRRGFCDPGCHECARACPTQAVRRVDPSDRIWAKIGTAWIIRQKCLAWEFNKSCLVCDEVCPYDAVEFRRQNNHPVPVPHVIENRCAGCGYCEHYCPVQNQPAIVVTPMDALRMESGSHETEARLKGFELRLKPTGQETSTMPPDPATPRDIAPGFDVE